LSGKAVLCWFLHPKPGHSHQRAQISAVC